MAANASLYETTIASIIALPPQQWVQSVQDALTSVRAEDRDQFRRIIYPALDLAMDQHARIVGRINRGLILHPTENSKAFGLMHKRVLAQLFIKHPTLCDRLCAKAENSGSDFGGRADVVLFRDIEKHKDRIEEEVEQACRLDETGTRDAGPSRTRIENAAPQPNTTQITQDTDIVASGSQDRWVRRSTRNIFANVSKLSGKVTHPDTIPNSITSPHASDPESANDRQISHLADTLRSVPIHSRGAAEDNPIGTTTSATNAIANDAGVPNDTSDEEREQFSLRETIEVMQYVAKNPWFCESALVHQFKDEYKVFQEYKEEAKAVEEEEKTELAQKEREAEEGNEPGKKGRVRKKGRKNIKRKRGPKGRYIAAGNNTPEAKMGGNGRQSKKADEWTAPRTRSVVKKSRFRKCKQKK